MFLPANQLGRVCGALFGFGAGLWFLDSRMLSLVPGTGLDAVLPWSLCSRTLMSRLILQTVAVYLGLKWYLPSAITAEQLQCCGGICIYIYSTINPVVKYFLDPA